MTRHPNSTHGLHATALDHAVDDYLADDGSLYFLIGTLTGAVKHGWTAQEVADHLNALIISGTITRKAAR